MSGNFLLNAVGAFSCKYIEHNGIKFKFKYQMLCHVTDKPMFNERVRCISWAKVTLQGCSSAVILGWNEQIGKFWPKLRLFNETLTFKKYTISWVRCTLNLLPRFLVKGQLEILWQNHWILQRISLYSLAFLRKLRIHNNCIWTRKEFGQSKADYLFNSVVEYSH